MAVAETQEDLKRAAWLTERRKGIGASEVGTILGLNKYESPFELFMRKTGRLPDKEDSLPMYLGRKMEPIIAEWYTKETGRLLHNPGDYAIQAHPDYSWLRATLDRTTQFEDDRNGAVELKAPGRNNGEWRKDDSPLTYQAQLQIQMACCGFEVGEIAAVVGNSEFYVIRYERNDDFLDAIIPLLYEFWDRVQADEAPPVDGTASTSRTLKALHPRDNGLTVQLGESIVEARIKLEKIGRIMEALEDRESLYRNRIIEAMGPHTYGEIDGVLAYSYKTVTRPAHQAKACTYRTLRKIGK